MDIKDITRDIVYALKEGNAQNGVVIMPKFIQDGWYHILKPSEFAVLVSIYEHVNTVSGTCWVMQKTIAEEIGPGRKATVTEAMDTLESHNLVRRVFARSIQPNGEFKDESNEILVIPYGKRNDAAYIRQLDEMLLRINHVVVAFDGKGIRRIVGTGEHTNGMNRPEFCEFREERRQEAIQATKTTEEVVEAVVTQPESEPTEEEPACKWPEEKLKELEGWVRVAFTGYHEDLINLLVGKYVSAVKEVDSFKYSAIREVEQYIKGLQKAGKNELDLDVVEKIIYDNIV